MSGQLSEVSRGLREGHSGCLRSRVTWLEDHPDDTSKRAQRYAAEVQESLPRFLARALTERRKDIARDLLRVIELGLLQEALEGIINPKERLHADTH